MRDTVQATRVPVLGHVVAGVPTPAQEELEGFVEVPSQWVRTASGSSQRILSIDRSD
jgi:SOS-response transcriptional repressor LexA